MLLTRAMSLKYLTLHCPRLGLVKYIATPTLEKAIVGLIKKGFTQLIENIF